MLLAGPLLMLGLESGGGRTDIGARADCRCGHGQPCALSEPARQCQQPEQSHLTEFARLSGAD